MDLSTVEQKLDDSKYTSLSEVGFEQSSENHFAMNRTVHFLVCKEMELVDFLVGPVDFHPARQDFCTFSFADEVRHNVSNSPKGQASWKIHFLYILSFAQRVYMKPVSV